MRKPQRVFSLLCDDVALKRDDHCVVRTDRGLELGVCVLPPEPCSDDLASRYSMRVVRKMTDQDTKTRDHLTAEEKHARDVCQKKINAHKIPMKLVDVEYTFDKHKIVFYFTADDRVDFREIVRDLAHELRTRIEMRHIQVRDEAKIVGGIGSCGRQLCCTTFLSEFKPISMRMAKKQNLSLNPSKISGQCGRLLCCLSYENDQYEGMKKRAKPAPKREDAKSDDSKGERKERDARPQGKRSEERDRPKSPRRPRENREAREKQAPRSPDSIPKKDAPKEVAAKDTPTSTTSPTPPESKKTSAPAESDTKVAETGDAAQPKQEQPKQEQPKQAEAKQEQPQQEQPKQAEAKQEQPQQEQGPSRNKSRRRRKKQRGGKKSGGTDNA